MTWDMGNYHGGGAAEQESLEFEYRGGGGISEAASKAAPDFHFPAKVDGW